MAPEASIPIDKNVEDEDFSISPSNVYPIRDFTRPETAEPISNGWEEGAPIVIDLGTYNTRVGYASDSPAHVFPSQYSKFRDRKIAQSFSLCGNDIYLDSNGRQNMKIPFDGPIVSNWEGIELLLDYSFLHLGVDSRNSVDNPLLMTELLGCPASQRRIFNELFFEAYDIPSVAYGIDSLFSYKYNGGRNGVVVSSANESTHIIPVVEGQAQLSIAKRINWGGKHAATYMQNLLSLKYPYFPTKITQPQASFLVHDHCYVSKNYAQEIADFIKFDGMEKRERVIQFPYTEIVKEEKTQEEIDRINERKRESGRRLQEQAAKMRLDKLMQKENDIEYYRQLQARVEAGLKKDAKRTLESEGFKDIAALQKTIKDLDRSIRKARKEDLGDEETEPQTFPLVDIPDDQLAEDQIKEKRKQRLLKANYDARMRAKEEKILEKQRLEEEEAKEQKWREDDLAGWIATRREERAKLLERAKEKKKLKEDLANRKSLASQMRMKNISALASNESGRGKRRRGATKGDDDPDDTFGADDGDWAIYRDIANESDGEEDEEEQKELKRLEDELLKYDPNFTIKDTQEAALDWRESKIHLFLHGPRKFDPESQEQAHRMNLNVERIRVPEVLFQPSIAGVDQAGILEILDDILLRRVKPEVSKSILQDIFLTGGQAHFKTFDERLQTDLRSILPVGSPLNVRKAKDPSLDAWKGMAQWALSGEYKAGSITREQYLENGHHYLVEHAYGNQYF